MTIEHEAGRIPKTGLSEKFLNRVLGLERNSSLPTWEELPDGFCLPEHWVKIIRQLADETIQNSREVGVVGYLPRHRFSSQNIRFGKSVVGTETSVLFNIKQRKFPFSLVLPSDIPVIEIHTHQAVRSKGKLPSGLEVWESPRWGDSIRIVQIPSSKDLTRVLSPAEVLLSLIIMPMKDGKTDIDVLVKCREIGPIGGMENLKQVSSNFDAALNKFITKKDNFEHRHLVDWKAFFGTVARTYKVGYYSSYDCSSAAHQTLSSGKPIGLIRVPSFDSLDAFLASPSFLEKFTVPFELHSQKLLRGYQS